MATFLSHTHTHSLLQFNGKTKTRPLLLALKGRVLDVREGADYYGPGGPYQVMAGRDARYVSCHVCRRLLLLVCLLRTATLSRRSSR